MYSSEFLQNFLIYIHVDNMPSKFLYLHYCRLNLFSVINVLVSKKLHVLLASVCNSWHSTPAEEKGKRKQYSIYSMFCTSADLPPPISQPAAFLQMMTNKVWKAHFYHKYAYTQYPLILLYGLNLLLATLNGF